MRDPSWMEGPPPKQCYLCEISEDDYDIRGDWNDWGDAHRSCEIEVAEAQRDWDILVGRVSAAETDPLDSYWETT